MHILDFQLGYAQIKILNPILTIISLALLTTKPWILYDMATKHTLLLYLLFDCGCNFCSHFCTCCLDCICHYYTALAGDKLLRIQVSYIISYWKTCATKYHAQTVKSVLHDIQYVKYMLYLFPVEGYI